MPTQDAIIGTGFKFPIKVNAKGGLDWSCGPERIQDSIWIILGTDAGERLMRPAFGAGIQDFVFEPNSAASRARLADDIKSALTLQEPRIELANVSVTSPPARPNYVEVAIAYRIRSTNELQNMVYPLFLQEGAA
jgi:phage baseplate assembly protein W